MAPSWHWTGHSGGYWQQVQLCTDMVKAEGGFPLPISWPSQSAYRRNSPTKLDPCFVRLVRDLFPTESAGAWSSSDRVAVKLIGYWSVQKCYLDHTRSLHDHFPINSTSTRPIPDHFSSAWLLDRYSTFLTVKNNRVGNPIDADHLDHLTDRFLIAWSGLIELIWSAVGTDLEQQQWWWWWLLCVDFCLDHQYWDRPKLSTSFLT